MINNNNHNNNIDDILYTNVIQIDDQLEKCIADIPSVESTGANEHNYNNNYNANINNNNDNDLLERMEEDVHSAFVSAEASIVDAVDAVDAADTVDVNGGTVNFKESIRNEFNKYLNVNDEEIAATIVPPDILIVSSTSQSDAGDAELDADEYDQFKDEPDVIKNFGRMSVTQMPLYESNDDDGDDGDNGEIDKNTKDTVSADAHDQTSWGNTPVDIVGDFEQEVEREFGLLVSGYTSLRSDDVRSPDKCEAMDLENEEQFNGSFLQKVRNFAYYEILLFSVRV